MVADVWEKDVWEKDVWEFMFLPSLPSFPRKISVREMSGKTPGSPRHPTSRHPQPSVRIDSRESCHDGGEEVLKSIAKCSQQLDLRNARPSGGLPQIP